MRTEAFEPGDQVVYTNPVSRQTEYGTVTSTNSKWVFVRYGNELTSKATHPDNLTLLMRRVRNQS